MVRFVRLPDCDAIETTTEIHTHAFSLGCDDRLQPTETDGGEFFHGPTWTEITEKTESTEIHLLRFLRSLLFQDSP